MTESKVPNKTAQHTPGPWKIGATNNVVTDIVDDGYTKALAKVYTHERSDEDPQRTHETADGMANARLIAAAPELLAVAQLASVMHSPYMSDHRCAEFGDWTREHDGDDAYRGDPTKRCNECVGCSNFLLRQMARDAIAAACGEAAAS